MKDALGLYQRALEGSPAHSMDVVSVKRFAWLLHEERLGVYGRTILE